MRACQSCLRTLALVRRPPLPWGPREAYSRSLPASLVYWYAQKVLRKLAAIPNRVRYSVTLGPFCRQSLVSCHLCAGGCACSKSVPMRKLPARRLQT